MNEPVITCNEDGTATLSWPEGLYSTPVAREVIEQYTETHNAAVRMRAVLDRIMVEDDGEWNDEITEAIGGWTP